MILVLNSKISCIDIVIDIEISGTGIDKCIEAILSIKSAMKLPIQSIDWAEPREWQQ